MMMRRTTVLIGADERVSSHVLARLLEGHNCIVLGVADDGRQLVDASRRMTPDVVIVDVSMPGLSAIEVLRAFAVERIRAKVIVMAMENDAAAATRALGAGAAGFLLHESIGQELIYAIQLV